MTNDLMLARMLKLVLDRPLVLRLYDAAGGTEKDLREISGGGYKPLALTPADWSIISGSPVTAEGAVREFRFDGTKSLEALGSYLTLANGDILWVKPFTDGGIKVGRRGDIIPVRPIMKFGPIL